MAERTEAVAPLDWTDHDADDHSPLMLSMNTSHGRATAPRWNARAKSEIWGGRSAQEDALLGHLREVLPSDVKVTFLAGAASATRRSTSCSRTSSASTSSRAPAAS